MQNVGSGGLDQIRRYWQISFQRIWLAKEEKKKIYIFLAFLFQKSNEAHQLEWYATQNVTI